MQPHRRHHAAHAAQILGSTFQPVVLEIARDVDDGVASRAPRLLLQRYDGAYESNIAGLLVWLVDVVGSSMPGIGLEDRLRRGWRRLVGEVEVDCRLQPPRMRRRRRRRIKQPISCLAKALYLPIVTTVPRSATPATVVPA